MKVTNFTSLSASLRFLESFSNVTSMLFHEFAVLRVSGFKSAVSRVCLHVCDFMSLSPMLRVGGFTSLRFHESAVLRVCGVKSLRF